MNIFEIGGITGLVLLLAAFIASEKKIIRANGRYFSLVNATGSILLGLYAWNANVWIFLILESVWAVVALYFFAIDKKD